MGQYQDIMQGTNIVDSFASHYSGYFKYIQRKKLFGYKKMSSSLHVIAPFLAGDGICSFRVDPISVKY